MRPNKTCNSMIQTMSKFRYFKNPIITDRYFFAPWSSLNESELEELASLASQLKEGLKKK